MSLKYEPAGACLIKYTPGVLHKAGEVPAIEWAKDFQTWEGPSEII